jgi:hypothetical protein
MRRNQYSSEKRRKELDRKKKQEEKRQKKLDRRSLKPEEGESSPLGAESQQVDGAPAEDNQPAQPEGGQPTA